ncbi:hypothetical protein BDV59DRAFT_89834 [Aspergillus ambiguus]|uniref:uncharacterized protein n=1 Tax=Aspergillus ambiguus TaxID=176160 RepID=UPI003CCD22E6
MKGMCLCPRDLGVSGLFFFPAFLFEMRWDFFFFSFLYAADNFPKSNRRLDWAWKNSRGGWWKGGRRCPQS